jgi:hypothetical protein
MEKHYNLKSMEVGEYRVKLLAALYKALGFKVTTFPVQANGLDMIVENDKQIQGIEVTNWCRESYLSMDRFKTMKANWESLENKLKREGDRRDYRRILVYSYYDNIKNLIRYLENALVELIEIDKQDLPDEESIEGWTEA